MTERKKLLLALADVENSLASRLMFSPQIEEEYGRDRVASAIQNAEVRAKVFEELAEEED